MNSKSLIVLFALTSLCRASESEPKWEWCSPADIERIAYAIAFAEFPISQSTFKRDLGISNLPHVVASSDGQGRMRWLVPLTEPTKEFFALRITYVGETREPPQPSDIEVVSIDIIFENARGMRFVHELDRGTKSILPELRARMKEQKLSPCEFAKQWVTGLEQLRTPVPDTGNSSSQK